MASRMKEDEKNEKIIRGLLRLPGNKRCINCNCLGPQYVCTNFWTFVCTTCSGIHREFTHRVKSISMAKFTSQEVTALQGAGNERAREIFFKEWDPQRHYLPDSSNIERLRDFIRHVYVDRRYTGDKSTDRPPRTKMGDREIAGENKRTDTYRGGSRSPPYEDTYDHRYDDRSNKNSSGERSPAYDQDYRRSPRRETYDDRQKDDRFGKGPQMRSDDRQNGPPKPEGRSPNYQKEMDFPSPPMIRPVRDILGEDVPPLRVGEPPKANGRRATDAPLHPQRTASSSSMGSADGNSVELKRMNSGSLIDFNADPEPPVSAVPRKNTLSDQLVQQQPAITPPSSDSSNWASFGLPTQEKAATAPSNAANTLVSQLSQLSTPATAFVDPMSGGGSVAPQAPNASNTFESAISLLSAPATSNVGHMSTLHSQSQQSSLFQVVESRPTFQQFSSPFVGIPNNQPWTSLAPNVVQGPSAVPLLGQSYLPAPNRLQERSGALEQPPVLAETKSSGRQELPENLFAASYGPPPIPLQRWQSAPPYAMGYGLQHPSTMLQSMPSFPQSQRSTNPFDLSGEPTPVQTHTFPSLSSIQGALPNIAAPSAQLRPSTFGTPSPQWPPQPLSYISALPQGQHMVHQAPTNTMTLGYQATGGFGSAAPQPGGFSQPPNSFSSFAGNPFG